MKRGGGRRYYRPDDVDLLRGIRHLLYGEGYTIRGVQRILREQGVRFVQNVWQPGAPQPTRNIAEDAIEEEPAQPDTAAATELPHTRQPQPRPKKEESNQQAGRNPVPAPMLGPNVASLPQHFASKLQAIIDDLAECRRLLDAANTPGPME